MGANEVRGSNTRLGVLATVVVSALSLSGCQTAPEPAVTAPETIIVARPAAPAGELPTELQNELQAALDQVMSEYNVAGSAAGVWIPNQGSWLSATGLADVESGDPVTLDMTWPIRSITKSYTVTMLLQLVDEGKVSLDDTIGQYVEGVTNGDEITLLQLANMSSGNADYVNEAFITEFAKDPTRVFSLTDLNSGVLGQPEQFAPGTDHIYTNANTNLIGAVIEKVTGQEYADALQERILTPLAQHDTGYLLDAADWHEPHATGYQPDPDSGELVPQDQNPSILGAAGSLFSTLDDGRAWAVTLGSGAMLQPETQELRKIGNKIPKPPYDRYAVGMGETGEWLGHNGEGIGFTAATFYHPESGAAIVVYMNESNLPTGAHPADQAFRALAGVIEEVAA